MLSVLLFLPLAVGLLGPAAPRRGRGAGSRRSGPLATLGLAIGLVAGFDTGRGGLQNRRRRSWIPELGVHYQLGVDGLNLFLSC